MYTEQRLLENPPVTLALSDCKDYLSKMPDNSIDAVITDPPYNIKYKYDAYSDNLPFHDYIQWQLEILGECTRIVKPGGSILYLNYPEVASKVFWEASEQYALVPYEIITWIYHQHTGGKPFRKGTRLWLWWGVEREPDYIGEEALKGQYRNPTDKRIAKRIEQGLAPVDYDWWHYEQVKNVSKEKTAHPCQLPEEMVRRLCVLACPPGGTVLDPFCGSGTTGVGCLTTGRGFIGVEVSPTYMDIATNRLLFFSGLAHDNAVTNISLTSHFSD
jgi:DNA modification methylase